MVCKTSDWQNCQLTPANWAVSTGLAWHISMAHEPLFLLGMPHILELLCAGPSFVFVRGGKFKINIKFQLQT